MAKCKHDWVTAYSCSGNYVIDVCRKCGVKQNKTECCECGQPKTGGRTWAR